jgi:peptidoglycan/xylan/chitin deacetylase (PgdA/CDA1 family)
MVQTVFSFVMYYLRGWQLVFWLYRLFTGRTAIAVLMYHRVVRKQNPDYMQGYEKGQAESDYLAQLREIERVFHVISLEEFTSIVSGASRPESSRPMALLTFDDGDSDNFTLAFPPLWERNWPAVSFIATDFVDSAHRFYHLRVTNAFNNLSLDGWNEAAIVPMPEPMKAVFESFAPAYKDNKYSIRRQLIKPMDNLSPTERDAIIDNWERIAGGKYTLGIECMSWKEISSLPERKIAVGSHTVRHNKLELISIKETRRELTDSKMVLESKLGLPVTSICYPQGSHSQEIIEVAERVGYLTGFTTDPGLVNYPLNSFQRLTIPRIGMGRGKPHEIVFPVGKALLNHLRKCIGLAGTK